MKKVLLFAAVAAMVSFASCKKAATTEEVPAVDSLEVVAEEAAEVVAEVADSAVVEVAEVVAE